MNDTVFHKAWNVISSNWFTRLTHKCILGLFIVSVLLLVWRWNALPPLVPLWYSRPWGADQLASPYWLVIFPLSSLLSYFGVTVLAVYVTAQYLLFTQLLFLSSLVVSVLSCIALAKILFLVT